MQTPWASEWKEAINSILTGVRTIPDVSLALSPPHVERKVRPLITAPPKDPGLQMMVDERLKRIEPVMRKPKVRYIWERDPIKEAGRKIAIRMRTSAANKVGKGSTNRENAAAAANEQKGELL
jgi:4Fe-4S ferredoxin